MEHREVRQKVARRKRVARSAWRTCAQRHRALKGREQSGHSPRTFSEEFNHVIQGRCAPLRYRAAELGKGFGHFHHTAYTIACAYVLLKKPEPAMKWLQIAADDGFPCYPLFERDPNLNSLRKNPRFLTFMARLKDQWEHYQATL